MHTLHINVWRYQPYPYLSYISVIETLYSAIVPAFREFLSCVLTVTVVLWPLSIVTCWPKTNLLNFEQPKTIASISYSIWEHLCCVSINAHDAYAFGFLSCIIAASSPLELLSTIGFVCHSTLIQVRWHTFSLMSGNYFPAECPSAILYICVKFSHWWWHTL